MVLLKVIWCGQKPCTQACGCPCHPCDTCLCLCCISEIPALTDEDYCLFSCLYKILTLPYAEPNSNDHDPETWIEVTLNGVSLKKSYVNFYSHQTKDVAYQHITSYIGGDSVPVSLDLGVVELEVSEA